MGGVLKKTLPYNWSVIFLLVDENLNFYVGYGETYYYLIDNISNYLPFIFPNTYTIRLGWEVYAKTSSTYNLTNMSGGYYQPPSYELTWPNNRIYNTTLGDYNDEAVVQNSIGLFKHVNFLNYSNAYSGQGSFTLQNVNTATNTEVIVVLFNNMINSNNSTSGAYTTMLGSNHLIYKLSTNQIIYNGTSIGTPSSYPDLNTANGQIYWEFDGGQVYLSRDSSNKVLLSGVSIPLGNLYGGIITSSATTSSSTYKFIVNNIQAIVPPPGPPLPPSSGSSIPTPSPFGSTQFSSSISEHTSKWVQTYSATPDVEMLLREEVSYYQAYADGWQSTLVFDFTIPNYKIGVGYVCTPPIRQIGPSSGYNVNPTRPWGSSYYLYYYYDSVTGNIYKDNVVIYNIQSALNTVGFAIDEFRNVYVVTSSNYYNIGSYVDYYQNGINNQTSITFGIAVTPSTSPFIPQNAYTLNTSKTNIYLSYGNNYHKFDGIYNRMLYDVQSSLYKTSITSSSTTNYKYIECKYNRGRLQSAEWKRYSFKLTIAPQDIILLFGYEQTSKYTPGSEYTLTDIQTPFNINYPTFTYVQSLQGFYANNILRSAFNLLLNTDNKDLYFEQTDSYTGYNFGTSSTNVTTIPINKSSPPFTTTSNYYLNFIGFFIKTSSPSTFCQIDVIPIT